MNRSPRIRFTAFTPVRALAVALLCGLFATAFGQALNTRLNGTVKDQQGGAISGAKVTLTDNATQTTKTTTSNDEGLFAFGELRAGIYTVAVEATGFKTTTVTDVTV